jgi:PncC family amidohydrolase
MEDDARFMRHALELAGRAREQGEVPVGAVVVSDGQVLGEGWNSPISLMDPSAHAEVMALRAAAGRAQNYRLPGTILYTTLEPCVMCAGAIIQARVRRCVFGAPDPKSGAAGSVFTVLGTERLNHQVEVEAGLMVGDCARLLQGFFEERRTEGRAPAPRGEGAHGLARALGERLLASGQRLVTAESCTGGWLAEVITAEPGSSGWFERGYVVYSNESKRELLGVKPETLERYGAVSRETAAEMAQGALRASHADLAVSITGVAGPAGGTPDKPVGTVWLGFADSMAPVTARVFAFQGDREAVRRQAVAAALSGLLERLGH